MVKVGGDQYKGGPPSFKVGGGYVIMIIPSPLVATPLVITMATAPSLRCRLLSWRSCTGLRNSNNDDEIP